MVSTGQEHHNKTQSRGRPHDLTGGSVYLVYVASDGFTLLPGFGNRLHETLQLCCRLTHFLRSGIDGAPGRDEQAESEAPATPTPLRPQLRAHLMFSGLNRCLLILGSVRITWVRSDISAILFMNFT